MRNGVKFLAVMGVVALSWTAVAADGHRDGYVFRGGKVLAFREGKESVVSAEVTLRNGSRLLPDGFIVYRDGRRERFRDDRWLSFEGEYIVVDAATDDFDGYWFEGGKVYVMRDRRPIVVTTVVTLRDGSRIEPDGVLIFKDGRRDRLTAGIRINLDGKRDEHRGGAGRGSADARDGRDGRDGRDAREKPIDTSRKVEDNVKNREAEAAKTTEAAKTVEAAKTTEKRVESTTTKQPEKTETTEKREETTTNKQPDKTQTTEKREEKK